MVIMINSTFQSGNFAIGSTTVMIVDMLSNKKLNPITELFVRGRKLNISLVFITQSYFAVPKKY